MSPIIGFWQLTILLKFIKLIVYRVHSLYGLCVLVFLEVDKGFNAHTAVDQPGRPLLSE